VRTGPYTAVRVGCANTPRIMTEAVAGGRESCTEGYVNQQAVHPGYRPGRRAGSNGPPRRFLGGRPRMARITSPTGLTPAWPCSADATGRYGSGPTTASSGPPGAGRMEPPFRWRSPEASVRAQLRGRPQSSTWRSGTRVIWSMFAVTSVAVWASAWAAIAASKSSIRVPRRSSKALIRP
jgi:hypothetical protein